PRMVGMYRKMSKTSSPGPIVQVHPPISMPKQQDGITLHFGPSWRHPIGIASGQLKTMFLVKGEGLAHIPNKQGCNELLSATYALHAMHLSRCCCCLSYEKGAPLS